MGALPDAISLLTCPMTAQFQGNTWQCREIHMVRGLSLEVLRRQLRDQRLPEGVRS